MEIWNQAHFNLPGHSQDNLKFIAIEEVKKTYLYIINRVWFHPLQDSQDRPEGPLRGP